MRAPGTSWWTTLFAPLGWRDDRFGRPPRPVPHPLPQAIFLDCIPCASDRLHTLYQDSWYCATCGEQRGSRPYGRAS